MINIYKKPKRINNNLKGQDFYEGVSIEKMLEQNKNGETKNNPKINNIFYTQKKDGPLAETNIKTDKWDIVQTAMQTANKQYRLNRQKLMDKKQNPNPNPNTNTNPNPNPE